MKTLWIVSGGAEAVPGIKLAKQMGLKVIVSDGDPAAPGFQHADVHFVISTYDLEENLKVASRYHTETGAVDGVICIAADVPLTVASIAAELGLPGLSVGTARLSTDKLAMKRLFAAQGIPIPWFEEIESPSALLEVVKKRGLPLVIKPADNRGARGVLRLTEETELEQAFKIAHASSPSRKVMVEEFLEGPQISTESVITDSGIVTPGFSDRNYEHLERFAPYIVENGGSLPSKLNKKDRAAVIRTAEDAAIALGLGNCTAKGDLVLTPEGPKVIELALRLSGGWFATDQITLSTGVDVVSTAIRLALGEKVDLERIRPRESNGVAIRYFFPPSGRVISIEGTEQFQDEDWIHRLSLFVEPGECLEPVTDHTKRAGFVITTGANRAEAVQRAEYVVKNVKFEIGPDVAAGDRRSRR